jgi:hypothetical protein
MSLPLVDGPYKYLPCAVILDFVQPVRRHDRRPLHPSRHGHAGPSWSNAMTTRFQRITPMRTLQQAAG